jgi:hypothetical protein
MAGRYVAWFAGKESNDPKHPHLHVILGGTESLTTKQIERAWKGGYSRIKLLHSPEGAIRYAVKNLGQFPENCDMSRRFIPLAAAPLVKKSGSGKKKGSAWC